MEGKFWGAWRVARSADIRKGGSLTLVSGFLSIRPRPNAAITAAVNGAIESLTRALAVDLSPVRVNCVSPGLIDTPIRAAMPEAARREMLAKTAAALPVGRVGEGEDIARQILAFMTIGFATGSVVYIDGGGLGDLTGRARLSCATGPSRLLCPERPWLNLKISLDQCVTSQRGAKPRRSILSR